MCMDLQINVFSRDALANRHLQAYVVCFLSQCVVPACLILLLHFAFLQKTLSKLYSGSVKEVGA